MARAIVLWGHRLGNWGWNESLEEEHIDEIGDDFSGSNGDGLDAQFVFELCSDGLQNEDV